ncbi:MAG: hypothetical protein ACLS6G_13545 [Christensenellales bacterium]
MSTEDYFRLLGVPCGPAMRERLDNAVRVSPTRRLKPMRKSCRRGRATARCICPTGAALCTPCSA